MLRDARPSLTEVARLAARAVPNVGIAAVEPLAGGRSNAVYRVRLDGSSDIVIRVCVREPGACANEMRALEAARGRLAVPELIHAEPAAQPYPFMAYAFVPGVTFRDIKRSGRGAAIARAAYDIGRFAARMGRIPYRGGTPLRSRTTAGTSDANEPAALLHFARACSASPAFVSRVGSTASNAFVTLIEAWQPVIVAELSRARLVHGDFAPANIVHDVNGRIAAVVDWEFACGASPLMDVGHFLRHTHAAQSGIAAAFNHGYRDAGETLGEDELRLARTLDLAAIAAGLRKDELPADAHAELRDLLNATIAACPRP